MLVMSKRAAAASATVLSFFAAVALLDSLHYRPLLEGSERYSIKVHSALDFILGPLLANDEKTYSAPLATHSFAKETHTESGLRDFPRLRYGGAHLDDLSGHSKDISVRILLGILLGGLLTLIIMPLLLLGYRRWPQVAWKTILLTLSLILVSASIAYMLARGYHVLGTDKVGKDVLLQALKSIRTGILIGTLTTLIMLPVAIALGILAGYRGGWIDDIIQYLYTTLNSIPGVLLIAAAVLMVQVMISTHADWFTSTAMRADARLLALCAILGVTSWTGLCRLLRGETLKLRELEYVQAARAFGISHLLIMKRHILPNLMHIVLIALVMDFSGLVLAEAVLSYVGIGVDATTNSFGTMINGARLELARTPIVWWPLLAAFVFMFTLVLAANLLADVVRDALDPRHDMRRI